MTDADTPGSGILAGMTENMPTRNYRIDDATYTRAKERAAANGEVLTALIREWVTDYAAGKSRVGPGRPSTVEVSRAELTKLRDLLARILS